MKKRKQEEIHYDLILKLSLKIYRGLFQCFGWKHLMKYVIITRLRGYTLSIPYTLKKDKIKKY